MIRRLTMLKQPDVAPDGTWCYFLSTTTLSDFDISAELANRPYDADRVFEWTREDDALFLDECGIHWSDRFLFYCAGRSRLPSPTDDLILWPTDEEKKHHRIAWVNGMLQAGTLTVPDPPILSSDLIA